MSLFGLMYYNLRYIDKKLGMVAENLAQEAYMLL